MTAHTDPEDNAVTTPDGFHFGPDICRCSGHVDPHRHTEDDPYGKSIYDEDETAPETALSAPVAAQEPSVGGNGWAEGAEVTSGRFQIAYGWFPGETDAVALLTHDPCAWDYVIKHGDTLAELVRRAGEHTEVCR